MQASTVTSKHSKAKQSAATLVTAYRCPETGELFPTAQKLAAHRRARTRAANAEARKAGLEIRFAELSDRPRLEATSLSEVCQLIQAVLPEMLTIGKKLNYQSYSRKPELRHIQFTDMSLTPARLNEEKYSRPLVKLDNPSQVRLRGHLHLLYAQDPGFFFSANLSNYFPYLHTGCGGASDEPTGYKCHYDLTLCLDDFPKLRAQHDEHRRQLALSKARETQVAAAAAKAFAEDPRKGAADACVEQARDALEQAQQAYYSALRTVKALQEEAKAAAEQQHPFDYDALQNLENFLK